MKLCIICDSYSGLNRRANKMSASGTMHMVVRFGNPYCHCLVGLHRVRQMFLPLLCRTGCSTALLVVCSATESVFEVSNMRSYWPHGLRHELRSHWPHGLRHELPSLARKAGIVGSKLTQGMDVSVRLFCVCVFLCVDSGLATD
jgi:hypothetical protein